MHTVQGFGVVNKAEVDVFLELSCFFDDPKDIGNLILVNKRVAILVNKGSEMQYLDAIWKRTEWSLFVSKANHSV